MPENENENLAGAPEDDGGAETNSVTTPPGPITNPPLNPPREPTPDPIPPPPPPPPPRS